MAKRVSRIISIIAYAFNSTSGSMWMYNSVLLSLFGFFQSSISLAVCFYFETSNSFCVIWTLQIHLELILLLFQPANGPWDHATEWKKKKKTTSVLFGSGDKMLINYNFSIHFILTSIVWNIFNFTNLFIFVGGSLVVSPLLILRLGHAQLL